MDAQRAGRVSRHLDPTDSGGRAFAAFAASFAAAVPATNRRGAATGFSGRGEGGSDAVA